MQNNSSDSENFNSEYYKIQFEVLKHMYQGSAKEKTVDVNTQFSVNDITDRTEIEDDKEVLRALYILEGNKLVTPYPPGDFTSSSWCLTKNGADIGEKISKVKDFSIESLMS